MILTSKFRRLFLTHVVFEALRLTAPKNISLPIPAKFIGNLTHYPIDFSPRKTAMSLS
jgi:hypothetical protein